MQLRPINSRTSVDVTFGLFVARGELLAQEFDLDATGRQLREVTCLTLTRRSWLVKDFAGMSPRPRRSTGYSRWRK